MLCSEAGASLQVEFELRRALHFVTATVDKPLRTSPRTTLYNTHVRPSPSETRMIQTNVDDDEIWIEIGGEEADTHM